MTSPDDERAKHGMDESEWAIWAKRNGTAKKARRQMTDEEAENQRRQRRLVNDQIYDVEVRRRQRWNR